MPPLFWYSIPVDLSCLLVMRQVKNNPWGASVSESTGYWLHPMTCLWGNHSQSRFLHQWWWCILLVRVCDQRAEAGRERLLTPQLKFMLTIFVRLHGRVGMQHQGLFLLSVCVLKVVWCAWLQSCGVYSEERIHSNMSFFLSFGPASEVPNLTHYGMV